MAATLKCGCAPPTTRPAPTPGFPMAPGWTIAQIVALASQIVCVFPFRDWSSQFNLARQLTSGDDHAAAWVAILALVRCLPDVTVVGVGSGFGFTFGSNFVPGVGYGWDAFFSYFNQFSGYEG
jgi:hypothetical protein